MLVVTLIELFSDLAFVVAIHVVAVPLEEDTDVFGKTARLYTLRVFLLWMAWCDGRGGEAARSPNPRSLCPPSSPSPKAKGRLQ